MDKDLEAEIRDQLADLGIDEDSIDEFVNEYEDLRWGPCGEVE